MISVIKRSVLDLISIFEGTLFDSFGTERLWNDIKENKIPREWLQVSFLTAHTTLSTYLIELEHVGVAHGLL